MNNSTSIIKKPDSERYTFADLIQIMAQLRNPEGGCPWDLEQDFQSIAPYTIEEAYEVADAIDRGDMTNLREELGDLLFQSVYHAQMASEDNHFTINDVIHDLCAKIIFRHPHVFESSEEAQSADDVNQIWESQKEKKKKPSGIFDDVPLAFPALLRAQKLQKRASKTGFEWPDAETAIAKINEEMAELLEAHKSGNQDHIQEEFGDLLFVLSSYARYMGFNAEEAMRRTCTKFIQRFNKMEELAYAESEKGLKNSSVEMRVRLWNEAKSILRRTGSEI